MEAILDILMGIWDYFAQNILTQPAFLIGFIVLIGYLLLKKPLYECISGFLMTPSRKSRDFSHGMDRPLLSPFMGLFVCFCIFLVIDIFLYNFFAHIAQCTHIVTWRPKMTAPILATSYFWMIL